MRLTKVLAIKKRRCLHFDSGNGEPPNGAKRNRWYLRPTIGRRPSFTDAGSSPKLQSKLIGLSSALHLGRRESPHEPQDKKHIDERTALRLGPLGTGLSSHTLAAADVPQVRDPPLAVGGSTRAQCTATDIKPWNLGALRQPGTPAPQPQGPSKLHRTPLVAKQLPAAQHPTDSTRHRQSLLFTQFAAQLANGAFKAPKELGRVGVGKRLVGRLQHHVIGQGLLART